MCLAHSKRVKGGNRFIHDEEKEMNVVIGTVGVSCVLLCGSFFIYWVCVILARYVVVPWFIHCWVDVL